MKTNYWWYRSMRNNKIGRSLQKMLLLTLMIALLLGSFSVTSVFAAPLNASTTAEQLEQTWTRQLDKLRVQGLFYDTVRLYPADFEDLSDLERANFYLEKFGVALRGAQTVVATHAGFDFNGQVTNTVQATQTVQNMALHLQTMRGMRNKLAEIERAR